MKTYNEETTFHHEQPHYDADWKEVNPEFGSHSDVPHDRDDNSNEEGLSRTMVFDFDEINDEITLRTKVGISQSTGLAIWTCSQILSGYLIDNPHHVRDERVLELGAGLGLCGIVAHKLGARQVLATDGDVDVLENLRYNLDQNADCSSTVACPQLVWGKNLSEFEQVHDQQGVILATDVFYAPGCVKPLWQTVDHLLKDNGRFLLAFCPRKVALEDVLDEARDKGFTWACPDITACSDSSDSEDDDNEEETKEECFDDHIPSANGFGYHVFLFKRASQ